MAKKRRLRVEIAGASIASADGDSAELAPVGRKASDVFGPWVDRWTVLPAEALAHLCRVVDTGPFVGAEAWAKREGDRFVLGLDPPGEAIDPADRAVAMAAIAAATPDMQRAILEAEVRRVLGHSAGGWFPGMWEPSPLGGTAAGSTNVLLVDDVDGCDERTLPMATRVRACGGRSGAVVPFGNGHFVFWSEGVVVVPVSRRFAARDLCDHAFRVGAGGGAVADGARATAQRVRELVAAVGVAVWHCDFANDAFTLDAAWSHAWPALGPECRSFGDLLADVHPDDRGLVEEATRGIPPFNDSSLATFRVRDGAGWRWLTMRARVLSRAGDAVEVLEGTLNDVTSVKRFEEQLLQAQSSSRSSQHAPRTSRATTGKQTKKYVQSVTPPRAEVR
jgi:PAS domain-containing protein